MTYGKRIVLNCPAGCEARLAELVEAFIRDGVSLVAIAGAEPAKVEDIIDELVVGNGADPDRFLVTSSHASIQEALSFAQSWSTDGVGNVQVVAL